MNIHIPVFSIILECDNEMTACRIGSPKDENWKAEKNKNEFKEIKSSIKERTHWCNLHRVILRIG